MQYLNLAGGRILCISFVCKQIVTGETNYELTLSRYRYCGIPQINSHTKEENDKYLIGLPSCIGWWWLVLL